MDTIATPITIASLATTYIEKHSARHHSGEWADRVRLRIRRDIIPRWGELAPEAVTPRMIATFVAEFAEDDRRVRANEVLIVTRSLYAWGFQTGRLDCANPALGIKRQRIPQRERALTPEELRVVWHACGGLQDFGRIVRLLILTGCRRQEIGGLSWPEVNRDAKQIELPRHRVKNRRPHIVPLSELALAQLPAPRDGYGNLFGRCRNRQYDGWSVGMRLLRGQVVMPHFTPHDLRRTFVTLCNELDLAPPHIIEATVNHVGSAKASVAGVYNKAAWLPQRRALLEAWAERLREIAGA